MNTTEIQNAAAAVLSNMLDSIDSLKAAVEVAKIQPAPGYVFVWPEYWLGVYVTASKATCQAVSVNRATITHKADKRVFTNGKGEQAVLMDVREALDGALAHAIAVHADFAERAAKHA
jgi:hypothetical protein